MPTERKPIARRRLLFSLALCVPACGEDVSSATPAQSGDITTWLGEGTQGHDGDGHSRLESWLNEPMSALFARDGELIVSDWNNHAVRRLTASGELETIIGQPIPGDWPCQRPAEPAECQVPLTDAMAGTQLNLNHPMGVALDGTDGSFFLAGWHNHKLLHYAADRGEVTVLAGGQKPGFTGDGGPASASLLNFPAAVVVQADGGLLVSDERNNRIRRIDPASDHLITTVVGAMGVAEPQTEGVKASETLLQLTTTDEAAGADNPPPGGAIALEKGGSLLIADTFNHCIRRVSGGSDGLLGVGPAEEETVTTVAGKCGAPGYSGDGGPATDALLNRPFGLALDARGTLYVADTMNHAVRRVNSKSKKIETVAGTGEPGFSGDGGPATEARLREPYGVMLDAEGNLYVVDTLNNRIRKVLK